MLMAAARWSDANINPSDKNNCIAAVPNELATLASCDSAVSAARAPPGEGGIIISQRIGWDMWKQPQTNPLIQLKPLMSHDRVDVPAENSI
jgi:hypothetical protein